MIRTFTLLAGLVVLVSCSSATESVPNVNLTPGPVATQELFDEIAANDSALFEAVFSTCNFDKIGELVTEDFEFYHDKWGLTATSGAQFVEAIRNLCERQKQGVDFRARRELVKDSMAVYPLNNYGAIQVGVHRFYAIAEGKKDQLTETARFTQVWKKDNGKWRVARVLSYDHKLAK
jgi:Domain of unknown function (DUF4440)